MKKAEKYLKEWLFDKKRREGFDWKKFGQNEPPKSVEPPKPIETPKPIESPKPVEQKTNNAIYLIQRKVLEGWITTGIYSSIDKVFRAGFNLSNKELRVAVGKIDSSVSDYKVLDNQTLEQTENKKLKEAYDLYKTLDQNIKEAANAGIPLGASFEEFVDAVKDFNVAEFFQVYGRRAFVEENLSFEEIKKLEKIFILLCEVFGNNIYKIKKIIIPKPGNKYDYNEQVIVGNESNGIIDKTFVGYINNYGRMQKAFVTIKKEKR